jgi:hypothetical protein
MRERMFLKQPASMFPFSGIVGRHSLDLDHNLPYLPGIPAQTREDNLAPAGRREHNVITHQPGWSRRRVAPEAVLFLISARQHLSCEPDGFSRPRSW